MAFPVLSLRERFSEIDRCSVFGVWRLAGVYSKRPFGGPQHVLRYLGRYTHRVAISNHRHLKLFNRVFHLP